MSEIVSQVEYQQILKLIEEELKNEFSSIFRADSIEKTQKWIPRILKRDSKIFLSIYLAIMMNHQGINLRIGIGLQAELLTYAKKIKRISEIKNTSVLPNFKDLHLFEFYNSILYDLITQNHLKDRSITLVNFYENDKKRNTSTYTYVLQEISAKWEVK